MGRKFGIVALCLTAAAFAGVAVADDKKKDEAIEIHEIMEKVPGKKGLCNKCVEAVKAEKWDEAAKIGADLKKYGEALGKNPPPKGSKDSWAKLSKAFADQMGAIEAGAKAKDKEAVTKAAGEFQKSCKACHDAHQTK
jgi:cytochrome c556